MLDGTVPVESGFEAINPLHGDERLQRMPSSGRWHGAEGGPSGHDPADSLGCPKKKAEFLDRKRDLGVGTKAGPTRDHMAQIRILQRGKVWSRQVKNLGSPGLPFERRLRNARFLIGSTCPLILRTLDEVSSYPWLHGAPFLTYRWPVSAIILRHAENIAGSTPIE